MKPIIPKVSLPAWKELYAAAQQFNTLEPWNLLDDLDLICVRNPDNGATGYGAVMGSLGTLFGFCLYRGPQGFDFYRRQMLDNGEITEDNFLNELDCIKVDFCSRAELEREDLAVIKQLNLQFRGEFAWPQFRSSLPGYAPWFLTESEVTLLTLGLKAACQHYHNIDSGMMDESLRDDECLMYVPIDVDQTAFKAEWEPLPVFTKPPLSPPILNLSILNTLKGKSLQRDSAWEADVFVILAPIYDQERPYFMRMPAFCHADTGLAYKTDAAGPEIADQQLMADTLCAVIKAHSRKPDTLFVKSEEMKDALTPLAHVLGITIRLKKNLVEVENFKVTMREYMMRGRF